MRDRKLLYINENGRLKSKHKLACGSNSFVRMYAVRADIIQVEINVSDQDLSVLEDSDDV